MSPVAQIVTDAATKLLITALRGQFASPPLSESIAINNGQGLKAEDRDATGGCDVYGSGGLVGVHTEAMHHGPFVVIGRKGSAGKVTFAPRGGWVTDTAYFATPLRSRELQCKFLFYALRSLDFSADVITTAIPGINRTAIYGYTIPLPPPNFQMSVVEFLDAVADGKSGQELPQLPSPLMEQRRVVARIEELAAQIHEARTLCHQAAKEANILESKLAANVFDELTCETKSLGDVALKKTGAAYRAGDFVESDGVPVVRLKEIETKKPTVFLRNPKEYSNVWLEPGDIVLAKTSFSTGAMCQWPGPRAVLNQNAVMLRAKDDVEQRYLFAWLGQQVARYLSDHLTDPNFYPYIRESELVRWEIPVPPLPEQRRIVAELEALQTEVDALKRLQAETAAELDALLPAILDKAFKGEL